MSGGCNRQRPWISGGKEACAHLHCELQAQPVREQRQAFNDAKEVRTLSHLRQMYSRGQVTWLTSLRRKHREIKSEHTEQQVSAVEDITGTSVHREGSQREPCAGQSCQKD